MAMTREEKNAYMREWNKKNRDKKRESDRKYREAHKDEMDAYHKAWRDKNREYLNEKQRERYKENPESFKERKERYITSHLEQVKESRKRYKVENRQKCTDYQRNKRHSDPIYKFRSSVTHLMSLYRKKTGYAGNKGTWEMIGCDFDAFLDHIQSQFTDGMTLENYGSGIGKWSIDHIEPIKNATSDDDVERLNHYTNLRPLWNTENSRRAGKSLGIPVYCIELDKTFYSASEAARVLGLPQTNISACCRGKAKTVGGYHWRYADQNNYNEKTP